MLNERQFKRGLAASKNCLNLPPFIFIGFAFKIKRAS